MEYLRIYIYLSLLRLCLNLPRFYLKLGYVGTNYLYC
ncbi:MAG: hypothetical protein MASP_00366 [Candidatus Methanolliviera sp. GoM_asphalt]|nr:MAG: hypothetical protein MASP_00366 [Candidatus Methanolliviera sp. GoM_asphalt]